MFRMHSLLIVALLALASSADATSPQRLAQLPPDLFGDQPDALPDLNRPTGPNLASPAPQPQHQPLVPQQPRLQPQQPQSQPEELDAPKDPAPANDPDPAEASRLVQYNATQNPWLPLCDEDLPGWLPELPIPQSCLDCNCDDSTLVKDCVLWRSLQKPTHPSIDQDCVVCVKEPCLGYEKVHETVDAVVQKCFQSEQKFCDRECEDGRCIEKQGTKVVRQLHPCTARVKLFYWKPVVKYRDVYYYIHCEPCSQGDVAVAQR